MSPIRVSPEIPIYVSKLESDIRSKPPSQDPFEVEGRFYVLPENKPLDHLVAVDGFTDAPGGMLETERLTAGHSKDDITLTTPEDNELNGELGVEAIRIDHVLYEATNPKTIG